MEQKFIFARLFRKFVLCGKISKSWIRQTELISFNEQKRFIGYLRSAQKCNYLNVKIKCLIKMTFVLIQNV